MKRAVKENDFYLTHGSANNIRMRSRRRGKIDLAIASSGPNAGPKAKENGRHDHERDHNCVPQRHGAISAY
jgi:hypothetical protein